MLPEKLAFIDVETTGGSYLRDRIIDIGILRVENGQLVDTYSTLINPQTYVPDYITSLTGISNDMLWNAPGFSQVKEDILQILDGCVFVAHNVRFDYGFVKSEFKRAGLPFSFPQLCTVRLSKALFPRFKHHNLDSLIERHNLQIEQRHRAFGDAKGIWDFYQIVRDQFPVEKLIETENKISKKITTPINISQKEIDNLPEGPGVYIFYDETSSPLYVGKSVNIKTRVLSHFRSDIDNPKELRISQQIHAIETIETSGELGALLKESALIKELLPLDNRALRRLNKLNVVKKVIRNNLETIELSLLDKIDESEIDQILGIFKTKKAASTFILNLADKYSLCRRVLGIENGKGFCFNYHLEKCKGVCGGEENPVVYNLRVKQAFIQESLKPWPFSGPIGIKEEDSFTSKGEVFVIDKWCFLGSIKYEGDFNNKTLTDYNFDYDAYKILVKYLLGEKDRKNIFELNKSPEFSLQTV